MSSDRISERAAAAVLGELGLAREQARQLLRTGAAGPSTVAAGGRWYDAADVAALRDRPFVDEERLGRCCPRGVHVARLTRGRAVDPAGPWAEQAAAVSRQPSLTPMTRALLSAQIEAAGGLPWVATVSGFVVLAALALEVAADGAGPNGAGVVFTLAEPGSWRHEVERRWFPTGRGRCWVGWRPPRPTSRRPLQE